MATIALIPAAGFGTRFHDHGPKALVLLAGKPLLLHALERLRDSQRIARAVIAAPSEFRSGFETALQASPLPWRLVDGGVTRRDSVANALAASDADDADYVCVHDAARPLVEPIEVAAVVDAAEKTGAAIAGYSVVETVKRVQSGRVLETLPRNDLFAATTPQVFRASVLRAAVQREGRRAVTDDSELAERAGTPVAVVLTSRWNIKITYPEDLVWAEAWLAQSAEPASRSGSVSAPSTRSGSASAGSPAAR